MFMLEWRINDLLKVGWRINGNVFIDTVTNDYNCRYCILMTKDGE